MSPLRPALNQQIAIRPSTSPCALSAFAYRRVKASPSVKSFQTWASWILALEIIREDEFILFPVLGDNIPDIGLEICEEEFEERRLVDTRLQVAGRRCRTSCGRFLPTSFDVIGDIGIFRLPDELIAYGRRSAQRFSPRSPGSGPSPWTRASRASSGSGTWRWWPVTTGWRPSIRSTASGYWSIPGGSTSIPGWPESATGSPRWSGKGRRSSTCSPGSVRSPS